MATPLIADPIPLCLGAGCAANVPKSTLEIDAISVIALLSRPVFCRICTTDGASVGLPAFCHSEFNFLAVTFCPNSLPTACAVPTALAAP